MNIQTRAETSLYTCPTVVNNNIFKQSRVSFSSVADINYVFSLPLTEQIYGKVRKHWNVNVHKPFHNNSFVIYPQQQNVDSRCVFHFTVNSAGRLFSHKIIPFSPEPLLPT